MSSAITKSAWVNLYKQLQKEADKIPQYNYRAFYQRRIRDHFVANRSVSDVVQQKKLYEEGVQSLESLKRQVVFTRLYPHNKTVVEQKLGYWPKNERKCREKWYFLIETDGIFQKIEISSSNKPEVTI
ncbi:hypothetical protein CRE_06897 [Caenorhabditis remanei]|uniref:Complex 1 LYR protein domain-containing protein n=1 Tax=Caenorhabditis remanei TaxID=31234 RepID=E3MZI2_CAERE|nr:hypothetical protein CRE_06897 [Caenorhabditis remanei]